MTTTTSVYVLRSDTVTIRAPRTGAEEWCERDVVAEYWGQPTAEPRLYCVTSDAAAVSREVADIQHARPTRFKNNGVHYYNVPLLVVESMTRDDFDRMMAGELDADGVIAATITNYYAPAFIAEP